MINLHRFSTRHRCGALCLAGLVCAVTQSSSPRVYARQTRTAKDGVYTSTQANRGEAVYQMRCAACHGATLAGEAGPPLAGESFLGIWDKPPLSELFDKIHNTMPADTPGTLTRPQVADVLAYVLQANRFPAGSVELDAGEAALRQISLASAATGASAAAAPNTSFPVTGNLNQVMRGILFPSSNVLFDVQTRDPGARRTGADATTIIGRYSDVYDPWILVDVAAISLAESGPLLMTPGRRCENGKPVPVDRTDWQQYVRGLVDIGRAAYRASQTRNQAAVSDITTQVSDACANCHRAYRDRRSAAMRCTAP
jgi:mono/diheme cytochrome c family protein